MSYQNILVERDEAEKLAVVTVNRPDKLNSLNKATLDELLAAFTELESDPGVLVVVLTGAGNKAFVAGADIAELNRIPTPKESANHARLGQAVTFKIERLGKPVIVAINGFALGGGLELAMSGDIRIASETAQVGLPEIDLGIMPGFGGTQRLSRLVGRGMAKLMVLTAKRINAAEAYRIGLVDIVVPAESLKEETLKLAKVLAAKAPVALKLAKAAINEGLEVSLEEGCSIEATKFGELWATEDKVEGTTAFLEKRKPVFKGK